MEIETAHHASSEQQLKTTENFFKFFKNEIRFLSVRFNTEDGTGSHVYEHYLKTTVQRARYVTVNLLNTVNLRIFATNIHYFSSH